MKLLSLFILIFNLSASIAHSSDHIWKVGKTSNTFYFYYEENDKHVIKKIKVPQDKIQEILETKTFVSKKSALDFINAKSNLVSTSREALQFSKIQTEAPGSIWPTKNEWTWEWEQKYSEWIKENFDATFFVKHNMKTDCADVAFALRWIFARINFLPVAQLTILSNRIFSNESVRSVWQDLPTSENWFEDQRFLAGLEFILDNTYTHSLFRDSYPIGIDRTSLMLGTHYLKLRDQGGHTLLVAEFVNDKKIYTLSSDVPRKVRKMNRYGFWEQKQPEYNVNPTQGVGGFLRMRWPKRVEGGFDLVPAEEMPFYSLEQYADDFMTGNNDFADEVFKRFGNANTPLDRYNLAVTRLFTSLEARVQIVEDGFEFCAKYNCSEGSPNYENHSTPSRDKAIFETISFIKDLMSTSQDPEMAEDWQSQLGKFAAVVETRALTLSELVGIWENGSYSSDPNSPILDRWGITIKINSGDFEK